MYEPLDWQVNQVRAVNMKWGVRIPLRDGVSLNGTLYLPAASTAAVPAIVTLTPYIAQTYHDQGMYFASQGFVFLSVDVRGRGNSDGHFRPLINEGIDAFDVVEWAAIQPWCNGQVAMWGGSYGGYVQWAAAARLPPHLATIVPAASPYLGFDFPIRGNISSPYLMQWLTFVAGRTLQEKMFWDSTHYWGGKFAHLQERGVAFQDYDVELGNPSPAFQEWVSHPRPDAYWDGHNPSVQQYAQLSLPVLTITGTHDSGQLGALMHYKEHLKNAPAAQHYLVIGPWDHAGTRVPATEFCGLKAGPASLVNLNQLHRDWYAWTMQGAARPEFLRSNVAYYVMGAEEWRYADSLEGVTVRRDSLYLQSDRNPADVYRSGSLSTTFAKGGPDHYIYDPRDVSLARLECTIDPENRTDQRLLHASSGKLLVYHSEPFEQDTEVCGVFRLCVWLAIDEPDTDFRVVICEVDLGGNATTLTSASLRARHRESLREECVVRTCGPQCYKFENFMFVARTLRVGHRLRLTLGPNNSIYAQKNYNSGGVVAEESMRDARTVKVMLFHDADHPSMLEVPIGGR